MHQSGVCLSPFYIIMAHVGNIGLGPIRSTVIHLEAAITFHSPFYFLNCMAFDLLTSAFNPGIHWISNYKFTLVMHVTYCFG